MFAPTHHKQKTHFNRASERSPFDGTCCGGGYTNVDSLPTSPTNDSMDDPFPSPR